jgi:hypothetical protein
MGWSGGLSAHAQKISSVLFRIVGPFDTPQSTKRNMNAATRRKTATNFVSRLLLCPPAVP